MIASAKRKFCFALMFAVAAWPVKAQATAGFAEWSIITPGGHIICHSDGWKEKYGDCLREDDWTPSGEYKSNAKVFVPHLKRWRYFEDFVAGENEQGFFAFQESSQAVTPFSDEEQLNFFLQERKVGDPFSDWLRADDGWIESWYPFWYWKPCMEFLKGNSGNDYQTSTLLIMKLNEKDCRRLTSEERMSLYRKTTWGRQCRELKANPADQGEHAEVLKEFCKALENADQ